MRALATLSLAPLVALAGCCAGASRVQAPPLRAARPVVVVEEAPPADAFAAAVRPILARRCDPCHNPGGRMYDRLPFDSPTVVADNRTGVLRRIKDPDERLKIEEWLARLPR